MMFGLDLPANWNSDWNLDENGIGVTAAALRTYIKKHDVFKTLKGKQKLKFKGKRTIRSRWSSIK